MSARRLGLAAVVSVCVLVGVLVGSVSVSAFAPKEPRTTTASGVTDTTAVLEGVLNPGTAETDGWFFAYSTGSGCTGAATTPIEAEAEVQEEPVSATVSGLLPNTQYTFCLVARNAAGEVEVGNPRSFRTTIVPQKPEIKPVAQIKNTMATFEGVVNPTIMAVDSWYFQYNVGASCAGGETTPVQPAHEPVEAQPVTAVVGSLQQGTLYSVCLVTLNQVGETTSSDPVSFTTTAVSPVVVGESFLPLVRAGDGTVHLQLDAEGVPSSYRFEYGTSTGYGSTTPQTNFGSGNETVAVSVPIEGLVPGTVYHFRVVATSQNGTTRGADTTFTMSNLPPSTLPDNRAYEQVTPVDKNGLDALGLNEVVHASPSGDAISFFSTGALPGSFGARGTRLLYVALRGGGGWTTHGTSPPASSSAIGPEEEDMFPDRSRFFVAATEPQLAPGAPLGQENLYEQDTATGAYRFFMPNVSRGRLFLAAVTPDDSHFIFETEEQLSPAATAGRENVYEWSNGQISLVGILPAAEGGGAPAGGTKAGFLGFSEYTQTEHAISDDGSRVFFTDPGTSDLYVREDADTAAATTVRVAENAEFQTANTDGSMVVFTKGEETNEQREKVSKDLYVYQVGTGQVSDLAPNGKINGVLGEGGSGSDSYIYFAAENVLAAGTVEGQPNIYVAHYNGSNWTISYIATVNSRGADTLNWTKGFAGSQGDRVSRVTPDGKVLLFSSRRRQSSFDNAEFGELYLYDAEDPTKVTCVSCDPSGAPATAPSILNGKGANGGLNGGAAALGPVFPSRNLSDSGSRVFFETEQSLVAQDSNGVNDVYEWERDGSGNCVQSDGCLSLVSTGQGATGSYWGDASANGNDVFFFTGQPLVAQDQGDELQDIYDARVDGAVVQVAPAACSGAACQGVPPAPPIFATPASVTFAGVGNFVAESTKAKVKAKAKAKKKPKRHKRKHRKAKRSNRVARGGGR
jgi:hypothetical protein